MISDIFAKFQFGTMLIRPTDGTVTNRAILFRRIRDIPPIIPGPNNGNSHEEWTITDYKSLRLDQSNQLLF